jgi:succinylglutamic semialdehyde dehydrogenase
MDRIIIDGPFANPAPFMGPVIDGRTAEGLLASFAALEAKGGRLIRPLTALHKGLSFLSPALIDMTDATDRPDEELFGPVLQMIRVADFEAAIREANATAYGLAASLLGGTEMQFNQAWAQLRAGVINWNRPTNGAPSAAPFGGLGLSGNHRPSAYYAADYCAYPVVSVEGDAVSGSISTGLRPIG